MMGLALGAAQRRRTLARMTTMGLDHPTGLVVTEAMPAVLAAVVAGLACALALPQLVGPALDPGRIHRFRCAGGDTARLGRRSGCRPPP